MPAQGGKDFFPNEDRIAPAAQWNIDGAHSEPSISGPGARFNVQSFTLCTLRGGRHISGMDKSQIAEILAEIARCLN